ncbi:hypothetical protein FA95DRAFT_1597595 [Auriscalpium vulgare]|uniref:Uncharacterized protein n=1 Tax=Auriscalpium vulgare TaxID=40419 RepID=A0ACB8RKH9_9AGAM|nr:hypothetical protein FA95DRAFT_1597595 [Auriscalpium vulgare]
MTPTRPAPTVSDYVAQDCPFQSNIDLPRQGRRAWRRLDGTVYGVPVAVGEHHARRRLGGHLLAQVQTRGMYAVMFLEGESYVFGQVEATVTNTTALVAVVHKLVDPSGPHEPSHRASSSPAPSAPSWLAHLHRTNAEVSGGTAYGASNGTRRRCCCVRCAAIGDRVTALRGMKRVGVILRSSKLMVCVPVAEERQSRVHPQAIPWTVVVDAASEFLCAPAVSYTDWTRKLNSACRTSTVNAGALKNSPVSKPSRSSQGCARRVFCTKMGSGSLGDAAIFGKEAGERWEGYWPSTGLLAT